MPATISDALAFAPTEAALEAAIERLAELGRSGGGAIPAAARRAALATFRRARFERRSLPRGWRHDYARMRFEELAWSSGRMRVPALPKHAARAKADGDPDVAALAVENAGGLAHLGSVYLEPAAPQGDPRVTLLALADAVRVKPAGVAAVLGRIVPQRGDGFTALATAFQNCGAYVGVPPGVGLDAPLQLVWTSRPGEPAAVFPRTVVRVGAGARATIVERHVGSTESLVCGVVELDVGEGAHVDYVVVQQADEGARVIVRRGARCAANASVAWHVAELGGALVRGGTATELAGEGASAETNAFFFARGFEHVDLDVTTRHLASGTRSRTIVRSAVIERARARLTGGVHVARGTERCDASLRDDALVLSHGAGFVATPSLEIAAHDVAALHASSVGSLAEEALFYAQSRGIARGAAERMVALAFFEPAIARLPGEALRDELRTALDGRLDEVPDTFVS